MKYNTKPIDFTGCHPVIAEHLKRMEAIECRVWDDNNPEGGRKQFVCQYMGSSKYPYTYTTDSGAYWMYAEPIPIKVKRIMPPERAIPVLIAEGWRFGASGQMDGPRQTILPAMFCSMGRRLDDPNTIIEEVEDDE